MGYLVTGYSCPHSPQSYSSILLLSSASCWLNQSVTK